MDTDCLQQTRVPLIGRDDCQLMYDETYRETINREAFSLADLWSQVGGFVGIFVGYSIMQIPATVAVFYRHIKGMMYSK